LNIKPADFFSENPAIDVPSNKNEASVLTGGATNGHANDTTCCT
jgi:primary-amine oxidase